MSGYSFLVSGDTLNRWLTGFTGMAARQGPARRHFERLHGEKWERLLTTTFDELSDGCLRLPDLDDLRRSAVPVQLVNGALLQNERQAITPAATAGADVAVVAGAGHVVPMDAPRVFAAGVEEFADRVEAGRTTWHERRRAAARAAPADPVRDDTRDDDTRDRDRDRDSDSDKAQDRAENHATEEGAHV
ncbi:hypothetical protein SYYSPA8_20440 [Streptomyces yaizuensis]|uniref:Alpha/beta hydrolase n=2 Tax=Streptomyces yaizuensis TaxID=2989713 RepID=A0ABQ5P280_9ACTN|nr:hypothetical protein SYYSPA8_20440 [Streptomyces sp. YSPA8]